VGGSGGSASAGSAATSNGFGEASSSATATGGAGGNGFSTGGFGGAGGAGGNAQANSAATSGGSGASSTATATAGAGGSLGGSEGGSIEFGGAGGDADANSMASSRGAGNASSSASAIGGASGGSLSQGGNGGSATAMVKASAAGGGTAIANAVATAGAGGGPLGASGAANATSSAETAKGALAQAQSTAVGSSGQSQSTAKTGLASMKVQSAALAQVGSTATTNAIAQGGSGQTFANPGQTAYAFATALPDKAYSATLIDGAHNVAGALLGPRDVVFGTAILGANYAADADGESHTYSTTSTFDFGYRGDVLLGLIGSQEDGFAGGLGFQSLEFTITADGVEIFDSTFRSLSIAESFFRDNVIDLGSDFGPDIDLTFGYTLVADGSGGFGFDLAVGGAIPETSTWAMLLFGFAGLGYAGIARNRKVSEPTKRLSSR
jgi:hypothetical protein